MTDHSTIELAALLAAVHAAPDDDGPRLVYADALLERGDADSTARGELIALQCRGDATPELRTRAREIVEQYGRGWHGPLAEIAAHLRYERGFLAACLVSAGADPGRVRALARHRAWATLSALRGSLILGLDPTMRALRTLWFEPGTAAREGLDLAAAWRDLLVDTPRALTELHYTLAADAGPAEVAALAVAAALPALRSLAVTTDGSWGRALLAAPRRIETLEIHHARHATLRGRDHLARVEIELARDSGEAGVAAVLELVRALPASVTELRVRVPDTHAADTGAIAAACAVVPPIFERTRRALFWRCPRCGSTSAGRDPTRGHVTAEVLSCLDCTYWESEDLLDDSWDADLEVVEGAELPAAMPFGL